MFQSFEQKVYQIINYKIPETLSWQFDISVPRAASGYKIVAFSMVLEDGLFTTRKQNENIFY